jgi:hypothetical protein
MFSFQQAAIGVVFAAVGAARLLAPPVVHADEFSSEDVEFFEARVRPILAQRCYACHGEDETVEGELRLTSRAAVMRGGSSGRAAAPGEPEHSLLLEAISYRGALQMPPAGKLQDVEIEVLADWVARGMPWPSETRLPQRSAAEKGFSITDADRAFWSFQPVFKTTAPSVQEAGWIRNEIDHFILARVEAAALPHADEADRRTLIRRATFDLTGLPPTPEEVAEFVADESPDAFLRVIDRLLASPHYGERWGRHWLDLVRYTDSFDARIADGANVMDCNAAWRYRDWVVNAINADMPYDQFVMNQIGGDLLPSETAGAPNIPGLIATGMLAIGNWGGGDADKEKLLTDIADDQIDVVGRAMLGLTLACARCHDHKFDPISTADYYGLAGIFLSSHILEDPGPKTNGPPMLRAPIDSAEQLEQRANYELKLSALKKQIESLGDGAEVQAKRDRLQSELSALERSAPPPPAYTHACVEGGCPKSGHEGIHDVAIHIRGRYDRLGAVVSRRFPEILAGADQPAITEGSGRLQLARWIARPDNPLTARVMVNRIWQHHFGEGLVRTPSNFGNLGERPTHPELLDWLAARFVETGWSMKAMHRLIMSSAAYQQSASAPPEVMDKDGDNRLFGRMNRRRLDAEQLRDSLLAVTGELVRQMGGVAVREIESPRRTLYVMTIRSDRSSFRDLFDGADATAIVDKRNVSTVAPQALFMMNHPFVHDRAAKLAESLLAELSDEDARIQRAYEVLFARGASNDEVELGRQLLEEWQMGAGNVDKRQAWQRYCHTLLCSNEFSYID